MRVEIYHLLFGTEAERARLGREHVEPWADRAGWYAHVATLDVEPCELDDVLGEAYAAAQHDPGVWTDRDAFEWVAGPDLRSTYVGDVLVVGGSGSRAVYEVAFLGWRRIDVDAAEMPARSALDPGRMAAEHSDR